MAAIYPPQAPQAAPVVPVYQAAQAPSQVQDPLFEALVKYITQGPGPSSVTQNDVQAIIDAHTAHPEGRAYLESIVAPVVEPELRIWKHSVDVSGFISTNRDSWTLVLQGSASGVGILYSVSLRASGPGLFWMQVQEFKNVKFFWDDFSGVEIVFPTITIKGNQVHVEIYQGEVRIPEARPIAEASFPVESLKLPPVSFGKGPLSIAE